jgi:hypothetical protein
MFHICFINSGFFSKYLQGLSHGKIYVAPLQDEELTIPVSTKPDNYKVVCIKCNMEIRSFELKLHEQSCQKSEQTEADFLEMEEGRNGRNGGRGKFQCFFQELNHYPLV